MVTLAPFSIFAWIAHDFDTYDDTGPLRFGDDDLEGDHIADDSDLTQEQASCELFDLLIYLKLQGKPISARDVCLISYYASLGGLVGEAAKLAKPPGLQTGKYNARFKKCTHFQDELDNVTLVPVPGYDKWSGDSVVLQIPMRSPQACIQAEIDDLGLDEFYDQVDSLSHTWGESLSSNQLVQEFPDDRYHPLGMFVDGVPFLKRDGLLGFSVFSLIFEIRKLCVVIRKSKLCHCGCQGWCTFYAIWDWFASEFQMLASGALHRVRHLLHRILGDWAEFVHTFGLPRWDHVFYPCFCCRSPKNLLPQTAGFSVISPPFEKVTEDMRSRIANRG